MSILFDIILALILATCVFIGYKHGLIRTLSKFISYMIAFTLANKFYFLLGKLIILVPALDNMLYQEPFTDSLTFLDRQGVLLEEIKAYISVFGNAEALDAAKQSLDQAVAVMIASIISFVLTFIIAAFLVKIILWLLNGLIDRIFILRQINGIFGGIFGLFNGFFWTWVVTNAFVQFLLPTLIEKWPNVFFTEIADSFVVQLCTTINPITYLITFINFIFH